MKINFKLPSSLILVFVSIIYLSGCASWPKAGSTGPGAELSGAGESLAVASLLRFDDLPVPGEFTIIPKESVAFQNDYSRFAFLKYKGKGNPDRLVLFFKEQMPLYNWELLNLIEYGTKVMSFEKADENCVITIEGGSSRPVIMISLTPKVPKSRK